jgi:hypothetical protein
LNLSDLRKFTIIALNLGSKAERMPSTQREKAVEKTIHTTSEFAVGDSKTTHITVSRLHTGTSP